MTLVRRSLRTRVTWAMVLVAAVSVAVVFAVFYMAWTSYTVDLRRDELVAQVRVVSSGLSASGDRAGLGEQGQKLLRVEAGLIGARLALLDDGSMVFTTARDEDRLSAVAAAAAQGVMRPDGNGVTSGLVSLPGAGTVLVVQAPVGEEGRTLLAVQPIGELDRAALPVTGLLAASALLAIAIAWAVAAWLARRLTGPLGRLTEGASALEGGEWGHQVPVEGEDEVAGLARAFNAMSSRVAAAYRSQKEFVGDVSHELRTPMTSIRGFSGAMLDGTVTDPEARERYLRLIHDESGRVVDLAAVLLSLADLDSGRVELAREPIDTRALAEALRARFSGPAADAGVELSVADLGGVPLGDPERLLQAVSALVENAIAYTPDGGAVSINGAGSAGLWSIVVDDSGPGVPPADRERVFERFVRLDGSRAKSGGGTGLGLSICRRLVELMDGTVVATDSPSGGARFEVRLPFADVTGEVARSTRLNGNST